MPVLASIREEFEREKPLKGLKIGMALHVEAKTANLVETLVAGGAMVAITGCNPLSTQDDVSIALNRKNGVKSFAKRGATVEEYYAAIDRVLDESPDITIDDGMDLIHHIHTKRKELLRTSHRGMRRDHHRCTAPPRDVGGRRPQISCYCGERYPDETTFR